LEIPYSTPRTSLRRQTLQSVAAFLNANLNGSMKLLRSEHPGIIFFAKVVQLLALKCGTALMFPEIIVVFIAQSRLKLYDFNIVDGELKGTQNVVVQGSEAADGMWQKKNMLTMKQTTGKAIIQLILHYVLFICTTGAA